MALVPFESTNHLLSQWSNNEPGDSQEVTKAVLESWKAVGKDLKDPTLPHTRQYLQKVHQYLQRTQADKRECTEDKIAWHLASDSNRNEAKQISDDDDLLKQFKSQMKLLEEKSSSDSEASLKTVGALIKKAEAIKSNPTILTPFIHIQNDILNIIRFQNELGVGDLSNLSQVSETFWQLS